LTKGRRYLLDTNVLSETRKSRMDPNVASFLEGLDSLSLYLSALTIGEFERGIEIKRRDDPEAAGRIAAWVAQAEHDFADRILPVDDEVARIWGKLSADRTRPVVDTLIAATAIVHDLVLVTRNVKDVKGIDMVVIDPWRASHRLRRP
jgi:toxin FitB